MKFIFEQDAYGNNVIIALHDYELAEMRIPGVKTFEQIGDELDAAMAAIEGEP